MIKELLMIVNIAIKIEEVAKIKKEVYQIIISQILNILKMCKNKFKDKFK